LNYLRDRHRTRLVEVIVNQEGGVPKTIVERAAEAKKAAERLARRHGDAFLRFDEVWCVFDVDQHPNVREAINQAQANGIRLAVSNPSFELWLLLHFQDQRAHVERGHVHDACRVHMHEYKKDPPMEMLYPRYDAAVARASTLEKWQHENGRNRANPSTEVHKLTERIKAAGQLLEP
jgi:hypothetical protein